MERDWMRKRRWELGLKQKEVAEIVGCDTSYICFLEKGLRGTRMSIDLVERIAKALGMTPEEVVNKEVERWKGSHR